MTIKIGKKMDRRRFAMLVGAASASITLPKISTAGMACELTPWPNVERCRTGIDSNVALRIAAIQQDTQWCWAACIQMLFRYYGFEMSQKKIVTSTWGSVVNMPATDKQIMNDLNSQWIDDAGVSFRATSQPVNGGSAAQELMNNQPLIICTLGHAMVLTSLLYDRNVVTAQGNDLEAVVRDPWKDNGRKVLTAKEWYGRNLLLAVRCTPT